MASLGHVIVGMAAARWSVPPRDQPGAGLPWALGLVALSLLPDADVVAFAVGIPYEHPFGHRGASHSLVFAVLVGVVAALFVPRRGRLRTGIVVALVVASHPVLDAMTDGGLGVALFWPFSEARIFLPWRPLPVAPIGAGMLSARGLHVLAVEALVFAPLVVAAVWPRRRATDPA